MGTITSNYPLSDLRDKIRSLSSSESRANYEQVFGVLTHVNAAYCECEKCLKRRGKLDVELRKKTVGFDSRSPKKSESGVRMVCDESDQGMQGLHR